MTAGLGRRGSDTVASVLRAHAQRGPDRPFVVFERQPGQPETTSYADLVHLAARTAGALGQLGVRRGDRVHVHLANCIEFYALWFAAAHGGFTLVPSNPQSTADELRYVVEHAGCAVSVTSPDLHEIVAKSGVATVLDAGAGWVAAGEETGPVAVEPTDPLAVLYTSGTTSRPKGVLVTHAAYLHAGDVVAGQLRLRPDDRQLVVLPLFHGNAQYYSTMSALVTGASIALAPKFSASRWSEQAATMQATVASLFAAPIRMILAAPTSPYDAAHRLRVALFAQNLTDAQLAEFERRFAVPLVQLYGMTETVVPPTMNPLYEDRRGASIGRPVASARLRVVDKEGRDAAEGELLVHGEPGRTMMAGYLEDPEATRKALDDEGWLHTGDTVAVDGQGYLSFVDRRKDLIKRAGENVSSVEVERLLSEHPAVFECAVIGVPEEMRDESIRAFVVLLDGAEASEADLLAHCREGLARFKVPDSIEFVDDLPRTSVGKIQKHLLQPGESTPVPGGNA